MKLLVAIPSKGRPEKIYKDTMRWVARTGFDVRVFVEPQDLEAYKTAAKTGNIDNYTDVRPENFVSIGENDKGLGFAMGFIKQYALDGGYDLVFKLDDDIRRFNNRGRNRTDDLMILSFCQMVGQCRVAFGKYPDLAAVGFGYRNELFDVREWTVLNARLQTAYIIRPEFIQTDFNTFQDFADYLYIRSQNKFTLRYGLLGIDCAAIGKNKGGLQMFNRDQYAKEEVDKLRKIYPALEFKVVDGKDWLIEPVLTGDFFGVKKL